VLEIRDLWPESILAVGAISNPRVIAFLEWLEMFAYRKADRIVPVTDAFKDYMVRKGVPAGKIVVIKNGVDLTRYVPAAPDERLVDELGVRGKFVASYFGTHGMAHRLNTILDAAEKLREHDDIIFLMIGEGAEREKLLAEKNQRGLSNVIMLPQQPKERMPALWALSDVSMVLLSNSDLFKTVIPSKIFESMAMQRPILLCVDGEARGIIESGRAGLFVEPENEAALAEAVRALQDDEEKRVALGANGRRHVQEYFDRRKLAGVYLDLLSELMPETPIEASY
jgi:glycosyltransferase involved in cell wall biosynthesis